MQLHDIQRRDVKIIFRVDINGVEFDGRLA